jgi:ABC-type branched-subunit amino acid transport system substrate-binding protein
LKRLALASVVLAVGCGTTVNLPPTQGQAGSTSGDSGLTIQQLPQDTTTPSTTDVPTAGAAKVHTPKDQVVSSATARSVTTSPTPAKTHHVSDGKPIRIGFITTGVGNASQLALNTGQSYSDQAMWSALVAEYNRHGGLDGHRIVPVYGATDTASSNWANQFQSVCAKFTQDNHVQAVIGYIFVFLPSFESCLAKNGVAHLYGGYQPGDVAEQQQYPTLVSTANPTTDGSLLATLDGGLRSGVLSKSTKLGLLLDSCADGDRAVDRTVVPWLKAHGIAYETVLANCAQGATDVGGLVTAIGSAELRFATSGVKVVLGGGVAELVFMEAAAAQGYRPQYLMSDGGAALEPNAPRGQLQNVHGFGWLPAVDVNPTHQPYPRTAAQKACLARLAKHGLQARQYNDFLGAYAACDGLDLYAKALATGATSGQEVATAVAAAESRFAGALTYDGKLQATARQRGGPGVYRQYAWSAGCSCFTYRGPTYPMPSP